MGDKTSLPRTESPLTIVVTGGSDGIGAAAVRTLSARGHRVLFVGRSPQKTALLAEETGAEPFVADFARLEDVRRLALEINQRVDHIDVLANNAGGVFGDRTPTADGFEKTFQVNHLAPFLLTNLLMDRLVTGRARIVNTSSVAAARFGQLDLENLAHTTTASANRAYGDSKLANILHARALHQRFSARGISAVAFHPGMVGTNFAADTTSWFRFVYRTPLRRLIMVSPEQGGATLEHFILGTPGKDWLSGEYYSELKHAVPPAQVLDQHLVDQLWERSTAMVSAGR